MPPAAKTRGGKAAEAKPSSESSLTAPEAPKKKLNTNAMKSVSFRDDNGGVPKVAETKSKITDSGSAVATRAAPRGVIAPAPSGRGGRGRGGKTGDGRGRGREEGATRSVKRTREDSDSDDDDDDDSDDDEDLSDLATDNSSDEDESADNKTKTGTKRGGLSYTVLQLRHLPKEFQESELVKFFGQFGSRVTNCFCVRSRRTQESKGTAYVQFADESVIPLALEECNGMFLGGRTVRARARVMHRPMPLRDKIRIRRLQGLRHQAHGPRLDRFDKSGKSIAAQLIKYSQSEKKNNAFLKSIGINFESHTFADQLHRLPREALQKKQSTSGVGASTQSPSVAQPGNPSSVVTAGQVVVPARKPPQKGSRKDQPLEKTADPKEAVAAAASPAGVRLPATSSPKKEPASPAKKPAAKKPAAKRSVKK